MPLLKHGSLLIGYEGRALLILCSVGEQHQSAWRLRRLASRPALTLRVLGASKSFSTVRTSATFWRQFARERRTTFPITLRCRLEHPSRFAARPPGSLNWAFIPFTCRSSVMTRIFQLALPLFKLQFPSTSFAATVLRVPANSVFPWFWWHVNLFRSFASRRWKHLSDSRVA